MTRHFKGGGLTGGQVHQGISTGPSASVTPAPGPPKPQPGPWSPQQTLNFVGTLTNGIKSAPFTLHVLWPETREPRPLRAAGQKSTRLTGLEPLGSRSLPALIR